MPDSSNPGFASTSRVTDRAAPSDNPADDHPAAGLAAGAGRYRIDWWRYRRTLWFAGRLMARIFAWELVLRRVLGEGTVGRGRSGRMRRWARDFRGMAVQMGGVMIKLGQFISSRMDILPPEVIQELASLQDEVPGVPFDVIRPRRLRWGRPTAPGCRTARAWSSRCSGPASARWCTPTSRRWKWWPAG